TEHYPDEARGKVYGSLQLTVYIRRDGSLLRVEIDRPAMHPVLNQAALRIVQLAAPFPPLPAELAADTDILAITRTWHFTRDQLDTRLPCAHDLEHAPSVCRHRQPDRTQPLAGHPRRLCQTVRHRAAVRSSACAAGRLRRHGGNLLRKWRPGPE